MLVPFHIKKQKNGNGNPTTENLIVPLCHHSHGTN